MGGGLHSAEPESQGGQTALHHVAMLGDAVATEYIIAALGGSGHPAAAAAVSAVDSSGRCDLLPQPVARAVL